jgi:hypothetical protein
MLTRFWIIVAIIHDTAVFGVALVVGEVAW